VTLFDDAKNEAANPGSGGMWSSMKQKLYLRLAELERISEAQALAKRAESEVSVAEIILKCLSDCGIEPGPHESLHEAFARSLGISPCELGERILAGNL
jgi:hypothetical protein